jgi:hypothetical protein
VSPAPPRCPPPPLRIVAKQDLIDLGRAETGNLDRRLFDNELLELDFEILKVPAALFRQPVGGKA